MIKKDKAELIQQVMKEVDRGTATDMIAAKLHISKELVEEICRMYVTHQRIGVDGILNRIESD